MSHEQNQIDQQIEQGIQMMDEYERLDAERLNLFREFSPQTQERLIRNELVEIQHWFGGWDELAKYIEEQRNSD